PRPLIRPLASFFGRHAADLLHVVFAVEQVRVNPTAAPFQTARGIRGRRLLRPPRAPFPPRRAARPGTRGRTADWVRRTLRRRCCAGRPPSRRRGPHPSRPESRRTPARGALLRRVPGILEAGGVVVADVRVFVPFGRAPTAPVGRATGE